MSNAVPSTILRDQIHPKRQKFLPFIGGTVHLFFFFLKCNDFRYLFFFFLKYNDFRYLGYY